MLEMLQLSGRIGRLYRAAGAAYTRASSFKDVFFDKTRGKSDTPITGVFFLTTCGKVFDCHFDSHPQDLKKFFKKGLLEKIAGNYFNTNQKEIHVQRYD